MSSLLINENPLQVLPSLACAVGLNEAVIAQQMHYWMGKSQHFYDGRHWIYNSVANWQKQFPFWSEATIKRALGSLENQGIIVSGNYNHDPRDRSKWYSLNYEVLRAIESTTQPVDDAFGQNDQMEQCKMTKCIVADCTNAPGQNDPMQLVNMTQPLPETTTETTQEITTETTTEIKNNSAGASAPAPAGRKKTSFDPAKAKPENVSEEIWQDWVKFRREIHKPLTETTCTHQVRQLAGHQNADEVIRRSIAGGWQGLFPEKVPNKPSPPAGSTSPSRTASTSWCTQAGDGSSEVFVNYAALERSRRGYGDR